ncbi:DUF2029 domain-containing protein [Naumannella sp. ID2617S]|nr:DUF2029 domain-containing protein [Naumannella sp. ID2617S]
MKSRSGGATRVGVLVVGRDFPRWLSELLGLCFVALGCVYAAHQGWFEEFTSPPFPQWQGMQAIAERLLHDRTVFAFGYAFSPVKALLSIPLLVVPPEITGFVMAFITGLALWLLVRRLGLAPWASGLITGFLLTLNIFRITLSYGDVMPALAMLLFLGWIREFERDRSCWWFAALAGIGAAIHPVLLVFPAVLVLARRWRTAVIAVGTWLLLTLIAAAMAPRDTLRFWTIIYFRRFYRGNWASNEQPLISLLHPFGLPGLLLIALVAVFAAGGVVAAALALRRGRWWTALCCTVAAAAPVLTFPTEQVLLFPLIVLAFQRGQRLFGRTLSMTIWLIAIVAPAFLLARPLLPTSKEASMLQSLLGLLLMATLVLWGLHHLVLELRARRGPVPAEGRTFTVWWTRLVMFGLPLAIVIWLTGTFFFEPDPSRPGSRLIPWYGYMPDFMVYYRAARAMVHGNSIYEIQIIDGKPAWPFLYPPFAALLALPAAYALVLSKAAFTAAKVWALSHLLHRSGLHGWRAPLVLAAGLLLFSVLSNDIQMGNIQGLMVALIFLDLAPGSGLLRRIIPFRRLGLARLDRDRILPTGVITGILAAIKIIPLLFVVYLVLTKRFRAAITALITTAACTLIGLIVLPGQTWTFTTMLLEGRINEKVVGPLVHYVSLVSALQRFLGYDDTLKTVLTALSMMVGLLAVRGAVRWHRAGQEWLALSLIGIATIFFSPLAWNYYYTWLVPLLIVFGSQLAGLGTPGVDRRAESFSPRLRFGDDLMLIFGLALVFCAVQFQLHVPGGDGGEGEWVTWQRLIAGGMPFLTTIAVLAAWWTGRQAVRLVNGVRPEVAGSADGSTADAEGAESESEPATGATGRPRTTGSATS